MTGIMVIHLYDAYLGPFTLVIYGDKQTFKLVLGALFANGYAYARGGVCIRDPDELLERAAEVKGRIIRTRLYRPPMKYCR